MFREDDIIEFISRIIDNADRDNISEARQSIVKFCEYLKQTRMLSDDDIEKILKVSSYLDEIIKLNELGPVDIRSLIKNADKQKVKRRVIEDDYKHYGHYSTYTSYTSSSCGGTSRSC